MAEIKLTFDLTFSRRFLTWTGAAAIMLCAVPELDSESVTLSTYYPAPSGVYTNMITTGNTFLARDGGAVQLGGSTVNEKLAVTGNAAVSARIYGGSYYGTGAASINGYSLEVGGPGPTNANGNATIFLHHHGSIAHQLRYTSGSLYLEAAGNGYGTSNTPAFRVGGAVQSNQGVSDCAAPVSYQYPAPTGGYAALCGAGQYVTTVAGFYTRYVVVPIDRSPYLSPPINPTINYMCCNCPPGGCTL